MLKYCITIRPNKPEQTVPFDEWLERLKGQLGFALISVDTTHPFLGIAAITLHPNASKYAFEAITASGFDYKNLS